MKIDDKKKDFGYLESRKSENIYLPVSQRLLNRKKKQSFIPQVEYW